MLCKPARISCGSNLNSRLDPNRSKPQMGLDPGPTRGPVFTWSLTLNVEVLRANDHRQNQFFPIISQVCRGGMPRGSAGVFRAVGGGRCTPTDAAPAPPAATAPAAPLRRVICVLPPPKEGVVLPGALREKMLAAAKAFARAR